MYLVLNEFSSLRYINYVSIGFLSMLPISSNLMSNIDFMLTFKKGYIGSFVCVLSSGDFILQ